ncbi:hypothetical protein OS493_035245 [Desmophyllum pertusum]|uniref:Uncharacterized protein n=1 Tax=Desmophyllum pertusum TaxID=174260 RepID=A0A9W9ZLW0_9CNID|nr:hypothetical protein OS493_035245 [Desmophyllum pertusum]
MDLLFIIITDSEEESEKEDNGGKTNDKAVEKASRNASIEHVKCSASGKSSPPEDTNESPGWSTDESYDAGSSIFCAIREISKGTNRPIEIRLQKCEEAILAMAEYWLKSMQEHKQKEEQCTLSRDEKKCCLEKISNSPSFGDAVRGLLVLSTLKMS